MEAASENNGKRKRGRPPIIAPEMMAWARDCFPDVTSDRHQRNIAYMGKALCTLGGDPEFSWITAPAAWKPGILAELGRIDDDEAIRIIARKICEAKPLVRDAERAVREWRRGKG
jgi:hypothetical protein